jgi:hypothetical protein
MADTLSIDAQVLLSAWFSFGPKTTVRVGGEGAKSVLTNRGKVAIDELISGGYVTANEFNHFGRMEYVGSEKCVGRRLSMAKMEKYGRWSPTEPNPALKGGAL